MVTYIISKVTYFVDFNSIAALSTDLNPTSFFIMSNKSNNTGNNVDIMQQNICLAHASFSIITY